MGPDHSVPKYNLFTWAAMLFAASIGVDLMFFGISGPATNFLTPPDVPAGSEEAARMAPIWTIFHYGIPGWAMYALMGMAFGLFAYRYHLPLSIRSRPGPDLREADPRPRGPRRRDRRHDIGTIFGISVSLGIGVVFLNFGLSALFGIPNSLGVQIALMALAVFITILSTVSGVDKGIRRLSELNVILAIILMLWVLFSGNTHELLNSLVQNIGDFFSRFPSMMMNTFAYTDGAAEAGYSLGPVDGGLDPVLLGLVDRLGALREPVPRAVLPWPHAASVRGRRAADPVLVHPAVGVDLRERGTELLPATRSSWTSRSTSPSPVSSTCCSSTPAPPSPPRSPWSPACSSTSPRRTPVRW